MAENLRQLRRKVRLVRNIRQITRAMQMVAAAKLRRVQQRVVDGRPYWERMQEIVRELSGVAREVEHPLLSPRPRQRVGLVVISSEKGLCGGYNVQVAREAGRFIRVQETPVVLALVGRKARGPLERTGCPIVAQFSMEDRAPADSALRLARDLRRWYEDGEVDEVHLCYARFVSMARDTPTIAQLLPVPPPEAGERDRPSDFIFEPAAPELLGRLLPRYVDAQVYHILLEAAASEHAARMRAMSAATENAEEMIGSLTMRVNRLRQQEITAELLDIVGGAEALA